MKVFKIFTPAQLLLLGLIIINLLSRVLGIFSI